MKKSSEQVARRQEFVNVTVVIAALLIFAALLVFMVYSLSEEPDPAYAKGLCPYEQILHSESVVMEKSFNKATNEWDTYEVFVYQYKYDGVPGIYIDCPELDKSLDLYGFDKYEVLRSSNKSPSFNIKIDDHVYVHPDEQSGTFMLVTN